MGEDKIICIIDFGKNALDNHYTIYKSGRINHLFDRNYYDLNNENWYRAEELPEETIEKLLVNCPNENYKEVKNLFTKSK